MNIHELQGQVVTVMGLGRFLQGSGVGAAKWLMRHGAQIVITDMKTEEDLKESVNEVMKWYQSYKEQMPQREIYRPVFVLGEHREDDFKDVFAVLQNPGVKNESEFRAIAQENNVPIFTDISLFFQLCPFPITAVTGSKGKSTTTSLIGELYRAKDPRAITAGNIKVSPLEYLDDLLTDESPRPVVLELSSQLVESLENEPRGPDIAVLTNYYPDHLDRYGSYEAYKAAKEIMFKHQTPDQVAVLNADQDDVVAVASKTKARVMWFSMHELAPGKDGCFLRGDEIVYRADGNEVVVASRDVLALQGDHNVQNVLAAVCVVFQSGVDQEKIVSVLQTFAGIEDRQELIATVGGVQYINDTTATNPDAAIAALNRFGQHGNVVLLGAGATKGFGFEKLGQVIRATCKYVVMFEGSATDEFAKAVGDSVPSIRVKSMNEAMAAATKVAQSGDIVLLSPGTSSFGIFKNEFDRGDQFKAAVAKLQQ